MTTSTKRTDGGELKPCPFCGGSATLGGLPKGIIGQVYCRNDDCFGPKTTAMTKADSIIQWNRRPAPTNESPAPQAEAGWQFVPVQITDEMKRAARWALERWREKNGNIQEMVSPELKHQIRWDAMLAAAPQSAPVFKTSHNSRERDPSVTLGCAGADTAAPQQEISDSWHALEELGFPPEACGWPFQSIVGELPNAIKCAMECIIRQRDAAPAPQPPVEGLREALIEALAGLKYIEPAIPVLRTMFMTADLALGARKAEEMDASNKEAVKKLEAVLAALASPSLTAGDQKATSDLDVHVDIAEALTQACEYFENRADVIDGDYGVPEPNTEMRLAQMCSDALARIPAPATLIEQSGQK